MKLTTTKYDAQRALNELEAEREAGNWATDTQRFGPRIFADPDDTVPMLPALVRPQAD
jgi:hypothetical protein